MTFQLLNAIPFPDWISPNIFTVGNFSVRWYGISFVVGVLLAYFWAKYMCARKDVWVHGGITRGNAIVPNKSVLEDMIYFMLLGIIVGGRIGSVLLYNFDQFLSDPIYLFRIWEGGMSFHGGFLGVCAAVIYVAKSRKIDLWRIADMAAIGAPLGIMLVRIFGNFFNQELYGRPTDAAWGMIFNTDPLSTPRHPSQLYEAFLEGPLLWAIIAFVCFRFKALAKPGMASGIFILGYGVFRIFVENFREPDPIPQFGFLTRGMAYSLPMVIAGLALLIWAARRPPVAPKRIEQA